MRKIPTSFIYFFGALGGLLFGYDTGVISGAILFIKQQMQLNSLEQGWVVSSVLLGAILGSAIIGPSSDKYGRRKLLLLSSIIFLVGALGSGFAPSYVFLVISRIILGMAVGSASALIPTYLAEISPADKRGTMSTLFQLMVMTGIFLAYIINWAFQSIFIGWRIMLGLAALPAALLFLGGLFLPESPRFLVKNNRLDEARQVLLNMNNFDEDSVTNDLKQIQKQATNSNATWSELFSYSTRPALIIGLGLAIFQQVMGCNTVLYYAPTILTDVGLSVKQALMAPLGIGLFNVIVTAIAMVVMDKIDRKKMLNFGSAGMGLSLVIMSVGMSFSKGSSLAAIICVLAMTAYIACFSATWGPVMWVMVGEVFPLSIRGLGNSFASIINWTANMIVSLTFPVLLSKLGTETLFIGYAVLCFLAIWFVKSYVFETRNRSLEEIEEKLRQKVQI